ncbi:MAG TPA: CaiB/BaiF CoA-transferase family protein [Candidatus Binataceae bacterium]|nr:CaiB/BaiF CoA-transferase family protein [Candidatus Binataceae bacterium]
MIGPLDGIRIIDVTQMVSGPMATMILADQGADVIKVEPPGMGDLTRALSGKSAMSPVFAVINRNKRSVVINLKEQHGVELLKNLVRDADLFVQNFRPGAAERMGIGYDVLSALNPKLVYVSISGFGEKGPYVHKRVYDPVVQALSGLASIQSDSTGRPRMFRLIVPDLITAMTAAQAMTAALLGRVRIGKGQHLKLAMLDAVIAFQWPEGMAAYTFKGNEDVVVRQTSRDLIYETADGYITVGAVSDAEWQGLARAIGHPEWLDDPRFSTPAARVRHAEDRLSLTAEALQHKTSAEWLRAFDAAQVPCSPVLSRKDLLSDPQIAANGMILEMEHPNGGPMRQPRPAARFDGEATQIRRAAPMLGEHTDEVMQSLGLERAAIDELRASGIVA